jgi:transcriptional regulator with XRE-family HTH domain
MKSTQSTPPASARIANHLRQIRKARSISQAQLAAASGLPKSTINDIESGGVNPSVDSVEKLASALGVTFEELLSAPVSRVESRSAADHALIRSTPAGKIWRVLPDPIPGVDLYLVEVEPKAVLPGIVQGTRGRKLAFCASGSAELKIAGDAHELKPGSTCIFPGDEAHSIKNTSGGKAWILKLHFYPPPGVLGDEG